MLPAVAGGRHRFAVYKHRGPCARCRGPVLHRGQGDANRTTWWCPQLPGVSGVIFFFSPQTHTHSRARHPSPGYYLARRGRASIAKIERMQTLAVFASGPLAERSPRAGRCGGQRGKPTIRLGFAVPSPVRLSVTAYPGARPGDLLETLLHELVHLHVGRASEAHAWPGRDLQGGP